MATTLPAADVCLQSVSDGDKQVGIQAFTDAACQNGGLGCYSTSCRFCKTKDTEQSKIFMQCPNTSYESAMTSQCASYVSYGDQRVGISAFYDTICTTGGLGCFGAEGCRYCKQTSTPQSSVFVSCPASSGTSDTSNNNAPTISCDQAVRNAGLSSISYVNEAKCNRAKVPIVGCVALTNCLLCRNSKTDANQYLISCKVLQDQQSIARSFAIQLQEQAQNQATTKALDMDENDALKSSALVGASVGVCGVVLSTLFISLLRNRLTALKRPTRRSTPNRGGEAPEAPQDDVEQDHQEQQQEGAGADAPELQTSAESSGVVTGPL